MRAVLTIALLVFPTLTAFSQQRLKSMPGYEQFQKMSREVPGAVKSGALNVRWVEGGRAFEFTRDGKTLRYDLTTRATSPSESGPISGPNGAGRRGGPVRGRQFDSAISPDGKKKAFYRQRNLWLSNVDGSDEVAITTDGSEKNRIKYATASWVYGEELNQNTAMWWSPDNRRVAFYRFDESPVTDFTLQVNQTKLVSTADVEAYPKAGAPNPIATLLVYDLVTKKTTPIETSDSRPFTNDLIGHYVYGISWTKPMSGEPELIAHRTNRRQNILELVACGASTGNCRVLVREEWLSSWTDNSPLFQFLNDGQRFIWSSERTGFRNLYLHDLSGGRPIALTNHNFEVASIIRIDEAEGQVFYLARSGDNHMKLQLHRVGLDGKGDRRLTDPALNHTVDVAPDGRHFIDISQTHQTPPVTRLMDSEGRELDVLARSETARFNELGLKKVELFTYKAADGLTDLHGMLHFPSSFDPAKKYPLLVSVYAGPATNGARETFLTPNPLTEYGFLVATLDSRSAAGRGKKFLDAIYLKLGTVEIDDQAAGVRALHERPYVDRDRVGIFGTSYGGYASTLAILRHPDLFQAASASSAVTSWHHYDTIYTERYMWIPQENEAGYEAGNAMKLASNLKGRLMIYYGTADNNVHPNNSMQLIVALQAAGKSFDLQVGPDLGHTSIRQDRMMEFFIDALAVK